MTDYYKVLNATTKTTPEELKEKYIRRLRKYHPDKTTDPNAKKKLELVKEAYSVLSDPYNKGRYDAEYERYLKNNSLDKIEDFFDIFSGIPDIEIPKKMPEIINLPFNSNNYTMNSYFQSTTTTGKDGKLHTKRNLTTNNNGEKINYYQEFTTDKNGKVKIIKDISNKPPTFSKRLKDVKD